MARESECSNIKPTKTATLIRPPDLLIANPKARLRDQLREVCRFKHLSLRTEEAYWGWVRRFLLFHRQGGSWAMLGQFPAAALIYRRGLIAPGEVLAEVKLNTNDLLRLKGTSLPQDASFDELRLKDVPPGTDVKPGQRLDPLLHYAGRAQVKFGHESATRVNDLKPLINRAAQSVTSITRELTLDYGKGLLTLNSPRAQGVSGALDAAGKVELRDLSISSELDLAHIVAVALDGQPLATSKRMLLQVMSEERASGFETEAVSATVKRIKNIGRDPWQVRNLAGTVAFNRPDAEQLKVTALDFNGRPSGQVGTAKVIPLKPSTLYYLISATGAE